MTANEDLIFLELALKRELVTQEQVDEILALQRKLGEMGLVESVSDLIVKRNVMRKEDAQALRIKASPKGGRQQITGYRLIERLGRGGMGSVYKAVQLSMNRSVAVKVLKPSLVKSDQQTARLRREAQLVGALAHPNIVRGLDFGISNGFHYFAMEYVEGESVRSRLERDGPLKEKEALRIVRDVAQALDHAHTEGIVHRDIKPGNILLGKDGAVKLADYGLAKGPLEDVELTQSGVTVGTPQYISPEQARGPSEVDIRTDIYSLGATLYHMVTGRPPYEGETLAHLIQQVLYEPYAFPRSLRRDLSSNAAFLIEKMMARSPRHRYQTPKDLLKDVEAIEKGKSIVPQGWEGDFEAYHLRRRYRILVTAAVAIFLVAGSFSAITFVRMKEEEKSRIERDAMTEYENITHTLPPPAGLRGRIEELEEIIKKWEGTPAAELARETSEELERMARNCERVRDLVRPTDDLFRQGRHREAIELVRKLEAGLPGGENAPARVLARSRIEVMKAERDQAVADAFREELVVRSERAPREAWEALNSLLGHLEGTSYVVDEVARDALREPRQLVERLDRTIRRTEDHLDRAKEMLRTEEGRNYREIRDALQVGREEFTADSKLQGDLGSLPETWSRSLKSKFDGLAKDILTANRAESVRVRSLAEALAREGSLQEAIDGLDEFWPRSLPAVGGEIEEQGNALETELAARKERAALAWEKFLPAFVDLLGRRDWEAAEARIKELHSVVNAYRGPNEFQIALMGAQMALGNFMAIEADFLRLAKERGFPGGLTFGAVTHRPVMKVVVDGRKLEIHLETGAVAHESVVELDIEDLIRESGGRENDPPHRLVRGIVRYAAVRASTDSRLIRDLLRDVESDLLVARGDPTLQRIADDLLTLVRTEDETIEERTRRNETEAAAYFDLALDDLNAGRYREAWERFKKLLEDPRLRETDEVKSKRDQIEDFRDKAERNMPAARLGIWYRTRAIYLAGTSVNRGLYRAALIFDFERPDELHRWRRPLNRIGIVEKQSELIGPPVPGTEQAGGVLVTEHYLRFKQDPTAAHDDLLERHPLRIESPFLYSREMAIEFRVRWERPLALVISLSGMNVVVLSDDRTMENGRGVYIWQEADPTDPARRVPDDHRTTTLRRRPSLLLGKEALSKYFQFEADRWYRVRFVKGEKTARLFVDDRLVRELKDVARYAEKSSEVRIVSYTPCDLDELRIEGAIDPNWYHRRVGRGK